MRRARTVLVTCVLAAALTTGLSAADAMADAFFHAPSRNISCVVGGGSARCDIASHTWRITRRPAGCHLDFGNGFTLARRGSRGQVSCAGDTLIGSRGTTLRYGRRITRTGITCTSRSSGMTCRNGRGHGFFVSRQSYRLF